MQELKSDNFSGEVEEGVTLVDFYASWCGPCKQIAPLLEEASNETSAKILKVDIDAHGEVAGELGVASIPTLVVFKDGKEMARHVGVMDKAGILKFIEDNS